MRIIQKKSDVTREEARRELRNIAARHNGTAGAIPDEKDYANGSTGIARLVIGPRGDEPVHSRGFVASSYMKSIIQVFRSKLTQKEVRGDS